MTRDSDTLLQEVNALCEALGIEVALSQSDSITERVNALTAIAKILLQREAERRA